MNTTTVIPLLSTQITTITTTDGLFLFTIAAKYNKVDTFLPDTFSPVTLSPHWSRLAKLLLISFLSVAGSIGNVFMISSVMVEDHLKKAAFLALPTVLLFSDYSPTASSIKAFKSCKSHLNRDHATLFSKKMLFSPPFAFTPSFIFCFIFGWGALWYTYGNTFIVNVALADLLITSILMPCSTIVLLAGMDEPLSVCRVQWFFAACAFVITVLSLATTAIENYLRLCTPQDVNAWFNKRTTTTILLIIWTLGIIASGMQYTLNLSFDFCTRKSNGDLTYQASVIGLLVLLPLCLTFYTHMRIIRDVKRFMSTPNFRPSLNYTWDLSLARTNFYSFLIFIAFWLPFGVVLSYHTTSDVANKVFYSTAWIGLSKSCFHNVIYCITNRHFRNAYVNLFHYCCCKTTVSVSRRQRNDVCRPSSDVRVHIIPGYNMYSYTSPQRSGNSHSYWNKRDVHEL